MSLEDVAAVLEIPLGTAKSRLAYGLNQLRQRDPERMRVARAEVLRQITHYERRARLAFFAAIGVEVLFLVGMLLTADFQDRTHVLIVISAIAVYSILALGLGAVAAFLGAKVQLVLRALAELERSKP